MDKNDLIALRRAFDYNMTYLEYTTKHSIDLTADEYLYARKHFSLTYQGRAVDFCLALLNINLYNGFDMSPFRCDGIPNRLTAVGTRLSRIRMSSTLMEMIAKDLSIKNKKASSYFIKSASIKNTDELKTYLLCIFDEISGIGPSHEDYTSCKSIISSIKCRSKSRTHTCRKYVDRMIVLSKPWVQAKIHVLDTCDTLLKERISRMNKLHTLTKAELISIIDTYREAENND